MQPLPPTHATITDAHTRTHAHTHTRTRAHTTHAHTHACTHARTHARTHTSTQAHTHACMHAHTHTRTHARMQLTPLTLLNRLSHIPFALSLEDWDSILAGAKTMVQFLFSCLLSRGFCVFCLWVYDISSCLSVTVFWRSAGPVCAFLRGANIT